MKLLFGVLFFAQLAWSNEIKQFVQVRQDRSLYIEYSPARASNYPTVILLNGLTWTTREWEPMAKELIARGVGVLRFDMDGMGQTLFKSGIPKKAIEFTQQAKDLRVLLKQLKIQPPFNLVGLSYGGGISFAFSQLYPREIQHVLLIAPYTRSVESQDQWIRTQIAWTRVAFPLNPATDDELYAFFLKQMVYTTFPLSEPALLTHPYKLQATFQLVEGIRKYRPEDEASKVKFGIHLMGADRDTTVSSEVLENFWKKLPRKARYSRIVMTQSTHKVAELFPSFVAAWTLQILKKNPSLFQGRDFVGYGSQMKASSGSLQIDLSRD